MVNYRGQIMIGRGYYKGKKRQRGGKKKNGKISDSISRKIIREFSKAATFGKQLAKNSAFKVKRKFNKLQKGGIYKPYHRPYYSRHKSYPEKFLMY